MANLNQRQFIEGVQRTQPYFLDDGSQDGTIEMGLIPVDSPGVTLDLASEVLGNSQKAYIALISLRDYVDGESFTLRGNIFFFRANPGGQDLPLGQQYFAAACAQAINNNANLNALYYARVVPASPQDWLLISARFPGPSYNFSDNLLSAPDFFFSGSGAGQIVGLQLAGSANRGEQLSGNDYGVYCDVIASTELEYGRRYDKTAIGGPAFQRVARLEQGFQPDNRYTFDAGPYLRSLTRIPFPEVPRQNGQSFVKVADPVAFYLEYGETFRGGYDPATGDPAQTGSEVTDNRRTSVKVGSTEVAWGLPGAIEPFKRFDNAVNARPVSPYRRYERFWDSYRGSSSTIQQLNMGLHGHLRQSVTGKEVPGAFRRPFVPSNAPNPRYFVLLNNRENGLPLGVRVVGEFLFENGTTQKTVIDSAWGQVTQSGVYTVDLALVAPATISGLAIIGTNAILEVNPLGNMNPPVIDEPGWQPYALLDNAMITRPIVPAPAEGQQQLYRCYWANPLGAYDNHDFVASAIKTYDTDPVAFEQTLLPRDAANTAKHQRANYKGGGSLEVELNSGWVSRPVYEWLKQCTVAPQHWLYEGDRIFRAYQLTGSDWEENVNANTFRLNITLRRSIDPAEITARGGNGGTFAAGTAT